ncbi:MAG: aminopeptidase, partial [Candidatus Zixiibacteriota bacterium]
MDPRIKKLAQVLVNYSVKLKKGQLVRIQGETITLPLMNAVFEEAVNAGAYPFLKVRIPENEEYLFKHGSDDQVKYLSPVVKYETDKIDALIHIWGTQNNRFLSGVDPKRQALSARAMNPIREKMFKRMADKSLVWVGTQFPTQADAQDADMSLQDYAN